MTSALPVPPLDLALVIPVRDDPDGLARLLAQARASGRFAQVVVVDDASDPPVPERPDATLIRQDPGRGGGVARNRGLQLVTAPYVLFFDADDLLLPAEFGALVDELAAEVARTGAFDLCLFKYADSRIAAAHGRGQPDWDERFWTRSGLGAQALADAPPAARPILARTANYPWNKIYRTAFLRDHGIGCAETAVHQDIPLHWLALIAAGRMLVSDRICAWHEVRRAGGRLTNRSGPERLEVFEALAPVAAAVGAAADPAWRVALADFVLGLSDWIVDRLDPAHHPRFHAAEQRFLTDTAGPWQAEIAAADPDLAARIAARIESRLESRDAEGVPAGGTP